MRVWRKVGLVGVETIDGRTLLASIGGVECSADGEYLQTLIESQIEEAWETIDFEAKIADLRALTDTLVKL